MSERKRSVILSLTGFISFLVGTIIYDLLLQGDNHFWRFVFSTGIALVSFVALYVITKNVKPEVIKEIKIENKDEREQYILGKASSVTIKFINVTLLIFLIIFLYLGYEIIAYFIGAFYVLATIFHEQAVRYYKKRI